MSLTGRALELFHLGEGPPDQSSRFTAIGRDVPRVDGHAKVTGTAPYAAEWPVEGLVHGAVVDSAIARGTIRSMDISAALNAPGVQAVVTHENAPRLAKYPEKGAGFPLTGEGGLGEVRQPLQEPTIYYGAQSIAVVVAETAEKARYAATLVTVKYDAQPRELDMNSASWITKPKQFSGGEELQRGGASIEGAFGGAPVRLDREYENPVYHHNPIEILASIACWTERDGVDHLMLYDTTRSVDMLRDVVSHSFRLPAERVHIVSKFIGGAFGSKAWTYHNPLLVAFAAKVTGRPLRLEWRRQQVCAVGGHRPAQRHRLRIGAEPDGRMRALHHWTRQHSSMVIGYTEFGSPMTKMMYSVPELGFTNELAHLNLPSPSVMRGPGFLTGGWALETALDELACDLGVDSVELRLRNYADIDPDSSLPFSNKHLRECYARGKERFGWDAAGKAGPSALGSRPGRVWHGKRDAPCGAAGGHRNSKHSRGRHRHGTERHARTWQRRIYRLPPNCRGQCGAADRAGDVRSGRHDLSQGLADPWIADDRYSRACCPQCCLCRNRQNQGTGEKRTAGLRFMARRRSEWMPAPADFNCATTLRARTTARFSAAQACTKSVALPTSSRGWSGCATRSTRSAQSLRRCGWTSRLGVVRVARLCGVYDSGRLINPRTARSQLMGGMIFGLGAALTEETIFDPVNGLPVVRNLADYHIPSCADTPEITIEVLNIPDPHIGELGAHGVGEMGTNGVPPAIGNAIFIASGYRLRSLPYTPDKLIKAHQYD